MLADLVITNALITTSTNSYLGGIAILDGKILQVGDVSGLSGKNTLDAKGLVLMPGVIDTQVHFREPGLEHKEDLESGTRSALHGGVTAILEMPNTSPATVSEAALKDKLDRANGRAWCHYGFFMGAGAENVGQLATFEKLPGCPGIKIFMGSSTGSLLVESDDILERVLKDGKKRCPIHAEDEPRNRERKSLISEHPSPLEHPFLRDAESARMATERILALSKRTGRPVHVLHISTRDELPLLAEAKRSGLGTTCEVTPQHLAFESPSCYELLGTRAQMNPPIRSREHREGLWKALGEGLFDVFGSDHAPHTLEEKSKPYPGSPSGMPGVQTMLPVLMNFISEGRLSIHDVVRMACENPGALYGMRGKGKIEVGYDADLLLMDPQWERLVESKMIQSKCGWSPYEGMKLKGWPRAVILNGEIVIREDERVVGSSGRMLVFE